MSEQQPHYSQDDDQFNELVQGLAQDDEFTAKVDRLTGKMRLQEMGQPASTYQKDLLRYGEQHSERPLAIHTYLVDLFAELCEDYDIDPNSDQAQVKYAEIADVMAAEMYGLKKELHAGDVLAVRNTMIVDIAGQPDTEGIRVLALPEGLSVVGTFETMVIAPMPDEVNAMILNDSSPPAVGVGLVLVSPVVMGKGGEIATHIFEGRSVIVSLSPSTTELSKYQFETGLTD